MDWLFKTSALVIVGIVFVIIYVLILISLRRIREINLLELGNVFLQSSSIIGGFKLIYTTFILLKTDAIESDKLYTIYGGFCVIFISCNTLVKKIKKKPEGTV